MKLRISLIVLFCVLAGMVGLPGAMWAYAGFRHLDSDALDIYGFIGLFWGLPLGIALGVISGTLCFFYRPRPDCVSKKP
jgi:hypothetical protein